MAFLDQAAIMIALGCSTGADPRLIDALAKTESGWQTTAYNRNTNGTDDRGALQINSRNRERLGISDAAANDPCVSVRAASTILVENGSDAVSPAAIDRLVETIGAISKYNTGDPVRGVLNGYARKVINHLLDGRQPAPMPTAMPAKVEPNGVAEPVRVTKGAQQIVAFDGWSEQ
jgi:type IV secretion system protein VirB1